MSTNGNDVVFGGFAVEALNGLGGIDTLYLDYSGDYLDWDVGRVVIDMENSSSDYIEVYAADGSRLTNAVYMSNFEIFNIRGSAGNDRIEGGGYGDTINGLGGDDTLYGRGGGDTFVVANGDGHDVISDFQVGMDTLVLEGFTDSQIIRAVNDYRNGTTATIELNSSTSVRLNLTDPSAFGLAQVDTSVGLPDFGATAGALFATQGRIGLMAQLAQAAYHLRFDEFADFGDLEEDPYGYDNLSAKAYEKLQQDLTYLTAFEIDLTQAQADPDFGGTIGTVDLARGLYVHENAAALVARSSDAVFVSFRGTDDGEDKIDWFNRAGHFDLLEPLMEAVMAYIARANAAGDPVSKVYLTGHSLGAAMTQKAAFWMETNFPSIDYEAVTFASPGTSVLDFDNLSSANITNITNGYDIIQIAAQQSVVIGEEFYLFQANPVWLGGVIGPVEAHSMGLYSAMTAFVEAENRREERYDIGLDALSATNSVIERVFATVRYNGNTEEYLVGNKNDFIMAGLVETIIGGIGTAIKVIATPVSLVYGLISTATQAIGTFSTRSLSDAFGSFQGAVSAFVDISSSIRDSVKSFASYAFLALDILDDLKNLITSDAVFGGMGNDILFGLFGHDKLIGGTGNDILFGGGGTDELFGGKGDDYFHGGTGQDYFYGGLGNDVFVVSRKDERITEYADEGIDTVQSSKSHTLDRNVERLILTSDDADVGIGNAEDNVIIGHSNRSTLSGKGGDDVIFGQGGSDTIYGNGGEDQLFGAGARDILYGGSENDRLEGGRGYDDLFGGTGDDTLFGDLHNDTLYGGADDDTLFGGDDKDALFGGSGDDTLSGGDGKDEMTGGSGADTFVFEGEASIRNDYIYDFQSGTDTIDVRGLFAQVPANGFFIGEGEGIKIAGDVFFEQTRSVTDLLQKITVVYFDIDGRGADEKITLEGHIDLTSGDFDFA